MVIQLIAKDKNEKFQYQGKCKLTINSISNLLLIEPSNEEFKLISAMFKWKFVAKNNILFIFAEYDFQDLALIFDNENICQKVYAILLRKGVAVDDENLMKQRFLSPLLHEFSVSHDSKLKEILFDWLQKFDNNERSEYIQLLKNCNVYHLIYANDEETNRKYLRKRKAKDLVNSDNCMVTNIRNGNDKDDRKIIRSSSKVPKSSQSFSLNKHIYKENFSIFQYQNLEITRKRLFIFTSVDKTKGYEYSSCKKNSDKFYRCCGCKVKEKTVKAKLCKRMDGTQYVKCSESIHICVMREYNPGKYIFDTTKLTIEKPNFEVIEFQYAEKLRKRLFIFSSEDKTKCYEYFWDKFLRFFKCCACSLKRKTVIANVYQKSDGIEYVKIGQNEHVCEIREYNPEKYIFDTSKHVVKKPHFEILNYNHHGTKKSALIIFCPTNMKLCNEYFWSNREQRYLCSRCNESSKTVYAKIIKNSENEEYVELSKVEHVCDLREYDPTKFKNGIIVPKSMYDIVEITVHGKRKKCLIIFTTTEKKMYYKFSYIEVDNAFRCCKCQKKKLIRAKFYKNEENGEEENLFLQDREHVCQPVEYNQEDFEDNILKKPDYQIIHRRFGGKWSQKLIVFTSKEKDYCYEYFSKKKENLFVCGSCQNLKTYVHARIIKNENEECIRLSKTEHVCKPRKYLPENFDLKIVKLPDFKIEKSIFKGAETTYLYIYTTPDKKLCYKYTLQKQNQFLCYHCKKGNAAAKLCKDENGEDYIELNNVEHICKPKEYSNSKIINLPNFKIIENDDNKKFLFVFDQNDNSRCYTFYFQFSRESFMCKNCLNKKRKVSAKLRQYENGEEYIEIMYNNHICEPEKYEPEKYANTSKKIFEPYFKIIDGGMKLNVYDDSGDKKIYYQYNYQNKLKKFRCPKCHGLNKSVTAKIVKNEENGEKYVKLGKIDHVCRSKK